MKIKKDKNRSLGIYSLLDQASHICLVVLKLIPLQDFQDDVAKCLL